MFSAVSSWWGGDMSRKDPAQTGDSSLKDSEPSSVASSSSESLPSSADPEGRGSSSLSSSTTTTSTTPEEKFELAKQALEDVSAKAANAAKEWGSFLFSVGKSAGKTVAETAKQLKHTVEEKTLLGEFTRQQEKFVNENKEKGKHTEAAVPPWVGYNEEEAMKKQIMALSADKRNFLRNPPSGVQFNFDFDSVFPVAMATLQEDPNLQTMRFELVPKQINEEAFWRNYFYRVSLIKQSTQLTSLAQQTGSTSESRSSSSSRRSSTGSETKDRSSPKPIACKLASQPQKDEELPPESPPNDNEFISDTFAGNSINEEEMKNEMKQLRMKEESEKAAETKTDNDADDIPQWEKELQKELQEYEMVNDGDEADDVDLEKEILQQIEEETKSA